MDMLAQVRSIESRVDALERVEPELVPPPGLDVVTLREDVNRLFDAVGELAYDVARLKDGPEVGIDIGPLDLETLAGETGV